MRTYALPSSLFAIGLIAARMAAGGAEPIAADRPPEFVPLGVYLSWERTRSCAEAFAIDHWTDVCRRLDALQTNHVNLLWVTNMAEKDLPRLIAECEKRHIRLLPSMSTIEAKVDWRWAPNSTNYDKVVPRLLEVAGASGTLVGWVLSDEPHVEHFPRLRALRDRFRQLDPHRFCTAVTMWPQTPKLPAEVALPVFCVDLYPFFGPDDPNGPHTDAASRSFFRRNAAKMIEAIGDRNAVGWVMGMCFSDVWGPRKYDDAWHMIGLPGSYLHWRCPTLPEMRWQVWETLRAGAKGYVCYTLAPEAPKEKNEALDPPKVKWKDVLAKEATDMGPNALTNPDASQTPQLQELGRVYARLNPHLPLIRTWKRTEAPVLEAENPGRAQAFDAPRGAIRYVVLLNDDLKTDRQITVRVGEHAASLHDVIDYREIPLTRDFAGGSATAVIGLPAGDGTILAVRDNPEPK